MHNTNISDQSEFIKQYTKLKAPQKYAIAKKKNLKRNLEIIIN